MLGAMLILAVVPIVTSSTILSASIKATVCPKSFNRVAVVIPAIPPPSITVSTFNPSLRGGKFVLGQVFIQNDPVLPCISRSAIIIHLSYCYIL